MTIKTKEEKTALLFEELDIISKALEKDGLNLDVDEIPPEEECYPSSYGVFASPKEGGYVNSGIIGWSVKSDEIHYFAYDPIRHNHDLQEGIDEGDAVFGWRAKDREMFIWHLNGKIKEILSKINK